MIELKNVSKYYNNNGVVTIGLKNINITFEKDEIVAIIGESGSGKSTLLNVICGVDSYEDGEMYVEGQETSYFNQDDMDAYRKKYVSFIYQSYNIIDSYSVLENVMVPLLLQGKTNEEAKAKATELIKKVGLGHRIHNKGTQLSGGEKQRCVIARALACDSPILACDEPTGNLDSNTGMEIIKLIKEVAKDKLVLIVTHNYEQVKDIVTRTIRVHDGEIVEDSKPDTSNEAQNKPLIVEDEETNFKTLINLSLRNLKNTPKKNVFSCIVLTFLAIITLVLYLACAKSAYELTQTGSETYLNTLENRIVVYDENHNALDMDKLSKIDGVIYENAFYEDYKFNFNVDDKETIGATITSYVPENIKILKGNQVSNENDVFFVFPDEATAKGYLTAKDIGAKVTLTTFNDTVDNPFNQKNCVISGYGYCDELTNPLLITKFDAKSILNGFVLSDNKSYIRLSINGKTDSETYYGNIGDGDKITVKSYYSDTKPVIDKVIINYSGVYTVEYTDIDVVYEKNDYSYCDVYLPYSLALDKTYEAIIYADNVNEAKRQIEQAGYKYILPSADKEVTKLSLSYMVTVFLIVMSSIGALLLTFIAYVILSRIYVSRNKDFTILRSLGLRKNKMARIVELELAILGFASSIIAFAAIYIASNFIKYLSSLIMFNNVLITIVYIILMQFFSNVIARRFNKRLFKLTISTSIKGEVARND